MFPVSDASHKVNKGSHWAMKKTETQYHKITGLIWEIATSNMRATLKSVNIMTAEMFQISVR